jgi:hypothetical protein
MILTKIVAVIFLLFVVCFIAIVVEESFLGGRRRRRLERQARGPRPESGDDVKDRSPGR